MDNNFQILGILLFAAVCGFLLLRLRSVLGRRTGNERRRGDPFAAPKPLPIAPTQPGSGGPVIDAAPQSVAAGLTGIDAVKAADPSFDEPSFLKGARAAFEIVIKAFAANDTAALEGLLNKDVYGAFFEAIRARQAAKESLQTTLVSIDSATIVETALEGGTALITVKFVSSQINVTRDAGGHVADGNPDKAVEKTDFWTFSRLLRARDPNWILVATHSP
jgi:predicted lipid-binding transport protein (Tim44 family)